MPRRRRFHLNWPFWSALAIFVLAIAIYIGVGVAFAAISPKRAGVPRDLQLALIARALDATLAVWFFAVGASIGSFLNVVAYRLPLGRTLGGHSACPFCCTTISPLDNIPVFAWICLRGRCRTCHLPISIQYPLVELAVGLIFLCVYFIEFSVGGSNLPDSTIAPTGIGLMWTAVTQTLAVRVLLLALALSGLAAAALIVVRNARPPLALFAWVVTVIAAGELLLPATVVVAWWPRPPAWSQVYGFVPSLLKLVLGLAAGCLTAAITQPFLRRRSDRLAWYGVCACLGTLLGWQAVPGAICLVLLVSLIGWAVVRAVWRSLPREDAAEGLAGGTGWFACPVWLADPVVWAWLGLLIFRANWREIDVLLRGSTTAPAWMSVAISASACVPLAWLLGRAGRPTATAPTEYCPGQTQRSVNRLQ